MNKVSRFEYVEGRVLAAYTGFIWRTNQFQVKGWDRVKEIIAAQRPLVFAAWHGMTMMVLGQLSNEDDSRRFLIIIPDDRRGRKLGTWAKTRGATPFTISMEETSMAAGRNLLALIRQLKREKLLYMNPDGPDGPSRVPKQGVAFIVQKSGAVLVPTGAYTAGCVRLPRWDRYTVPFPYSRVSIVFGEPMEIPPGADRDEARLEIRERLNQAEQAAIELYRSGDQAVTQL